MSETANEKSTVSGEDRLYDFFKHLTTLSLLTLGGILTIGNSADVEIDVVPLMVVVRLVAIGGIGAYSGMLQIVESSLSQEKRPKRLAFYKGAATLGFGMGTGAFLSIFMLGLGG